MNSYIDNLHWLSSCLISIEGSTILFKYIYLNCLIYSIYNEIALIYKCKVKIKSYVKTWKSLVTKYQKKHRSEIEISAKIEANKLWKGFLRIFLWMNMKCCHNKANTLMKKIIFIVDGKNLMILNNNLNIIWLFLFYNNCCLSLFVVNPLGQIYLKIFKRVFQQ